MITHYPDFFSLSKIILVGSTVNNASSPRKKTILFQGSNTGSPTKQDTFKSKLETKTKKAGFVSPPKRSLLEDLALNHVMRVNQKKAAEVGKPLRGDQLGAKPIPPPLFPEGKITKSDMEKKIPHKDVVQFLKAGEVFDIIGGINYCGIIGLKHDQTIGDQIVDKRKLNYKV